MNKKQYLYALGVILVAGLFLGNAMHIPIGVQFVTPALGSVYYFFGGENQILVPHAIAFYMWNGHWPGFIDWLQFLLGLGLGYYISVAIAAALAAAGVITWSVVIAILSATGIGITFAGAILGF